MSIMLSFGGTSAGGAWDDRELVNAYDTAMEEFHAHHPGPGSWLDKVTAQKALEDKVGSSSHSNPAWYSAPAVLSDAQQEDESEDPLPRPKKRSKNRNYNIHPSNDKRLANPYTTSTTAPDQTAGSPTSPRYSPPSPESAESHDAGPSHMSLRLPINASSTEDQSPIPATTGSAPQQYPQPPAPISIAPISAVSSADALSYAMTSQYWAGYWMGVSQAIQHADDQRPEVSDSRVRPDDQETTHPSPRSNVMVSKHRVLKR